MGHNSGLLPHEACCRMVCPGMHLLCRRVASRSALSSTNTRCTFGSGRTCRPCGEEREAEAEFAVGGPPQSLGTVWHTHGTMHHSPRHAPALLGCRTHTLACGARPLSR